MAKQMTQSEFEAQQTNNEASQLIEGSSPCVPLL